jgi:hypothetical protein
MFRIVTVVCAHVLYCDSGTFTCFVLWQWYVDLYCIVTRVREKKSSAVQRRMIRWSVNSESGFGVSTDTVEQRRRITKVLGHNSLLYLSSALPDRDAVLVPMCPPRAVTLCIYHVPPSVAGLAQSVLWLDVRGVVVLFPAGERYCFPLRSV